MNTLLRETFTTKAIFSCYITLYKSMTDFFFLNYPSGLTLQLAFLSENQYLLINHKRIQQHSGIKSITTPPTEKKVSKNCVIPHLTMLLVFQLLGCKGD